MTKSTDWSNIVARFFVGQSKVSCGTGYGGAVLFDRHCWALGNGRSTGLCWGSP